MTGRVQVAILLTGAGLSRSAYAQAPLKFEVASVKPSMSADGAPFVRTSGGLTATADLDLLLEMAFQTRLIDLSKVPDSLQSQRFEIVAKAAGRISGDQYWEMLQTLLEEQFKLAFTARLWIN
jgi:uncharacterized protein (TIGR03435 family)